MKLKKLLNKQIAYNQIEDLIFTCTVCNIKQNSKDFIQIIPKCSIHECPHKKGFYFPEFLSEEDLEYIQFNKEHECQPVFSFIFREKDK